MKKGSLVAAAIVAVLGGLGWLAWTLLLAPPHDAAAPAASATHAAAPPAKATAPVVEEAKPADATPTRAAESIAPPPAAPIETEMPASYRKALSGVRGRLVEEDGKPIPGLEVELLEMVPSAMLGDFSSVFAGVTPKFPNLSVAKGKSGADGTFTLDGTHGTVPHGLGIDLGGPRGTLRVIDRTLTSGEVTDLGDLVLGAFVTFRGKIEDEDGKPVANARVRATALPAIVFQPGVADVGRAIGVLGNERMGAELIEFPAAMRAWESRLPLPTTKSGDDGAFELKGVPQGIVTLVVDRDGYSGTFKGPTTTGKRDRDVGTISLSRGITLKGVAVDVAGHPLANALVFAGVDIQGTPLALLFPAAPTGADGRFEVPHLPDAARSLRVAARANLLQPVTVVAVDDPGRDVTVTLPGSCSVDVALKSKRDGSVVADAELWINATPYIPVLSFASPKRIPAAQIEHVADGHLRVSGLGAGHCALYGKAPGLARTSVECDVTADPKEVTLEFAPATTLAVQVVDAATKLPIEWADVSATPESQHQAPLVARRTDVTGLAQLPELPVASDAKLRLHVSHPAYAPQMRTLAASATATAPEVFEMTPGAAIHGRAHAGGGPLPEPVLITFEYRDRVRDIDDSFPRLAVPGLDGTFELKGMAPGPVHWEVIPRAFAGDVTKSFEKLASITRLRAGTIELKEGETSELDVDLDPRMADAPAKITGLVHVRGGRRPEKLKLHTNSQQPGGDKNEQRDFDVRPEERFSFELPPGWINVSLMEVQPPNSANPMQTLHQTWFQLDPGQTQDVSTELEFVHARVQIVDDAGQPIAHVGVTISEMKSGENLMPTNLWSQSGDDGTVESDLPRPGRWRYMANSNEAGRGEGEFEFPNARTERIVLTRGVPCAGRIEIENDAEVDQPYWLSVQQRVDQGGINYIGGTQIPKDQRTFELVGLAPGKYEIYLYGQRWSQTPVAIELTAAGRRDLVLRYKLADPPPKREK